MDSASAWKLRNAAKFNRINNKLTITKAISTPATILQIRRARPVFHRQLLGDAGQLLRCSAALRLWRDLRPQQSRGGGVQLLRQPDQQVRVRHGPAFFPFGDGLPHHMESGGQLLLGEALGLPQGLQILCKHCVASFPGSFYQGNRRCGKQRQTHMAP